MKAQLYRIPGPWTGKLVIVPRPRSGDWLEAEVRAWQTAGIDTVVSLLTPSEEWELGLDREAEVSQGMGIRFIASPIPDRQTPRSAEEIRNLSGQLSALLTKGQTVAIHCRQSVGRSALLAAALLVEAGISPDDAFDRIARARGCPVPDTPEQRRWVERFANRKKEPLLV
jgi:protein-tyrosine phosphatase